MSKISYSDYHRDEDYLKFQNQFRNIFMLRFNLLRRFVKFPKTVLDIGCSTGTFLDLFTDSETWGVEPSTSAIIARKKGHKIINNVFEKANPPKNYFDLVIMNHTLEHLDDPLLVLKKARGLLKEGGLILVDVPNAGGLSAKIMGDHWPFLTPEEHKHQFTQESLSKIMQEAGFTILHFESRSGICEYADPLGEVWDSIATLKKRFIRDIIMAPYSIFVTLFNIGDSMSVIGRK